MPTHEQIIEETAKLVADGISVTLPVRGRSMLPFIVGGRDSVILKKHGHLRTGDIVLARVDGCRYVLHRIILIDGDDIALMGDGNLAATEHCTASDVMALATHTVNESGKVRYLYTRRRRYLSWLWSLLLPLRRYLLPGLCRWTNIW